MAFEVSRSHSHPFENSDKIDRRQSRARGSTMMVLAPEWLQGYYTLCGDQPSGDYHGTRS
jgi:hypothetical protein